MHTQSTDIDARPMVEAVLADALRRGASDLHLEPGREGFEIRMRIDGVLATRGRETLEGGRAMVSRLMVGARLLTYRLDIPQEGRLSLDGPGGKPVELRLAVMPTIHGLRAVVRMPAELVEPMDLDNLGLPGGVLDAMRAFARADAGMLILTGPAGSGKTTTIYALLRHIAGQEAGISIVALEDPVERALPGVTQIEVTPQGQLTYERGLRSILRQDPQVLMLGEIRDAATATLAIQAALSGHRLITTLHAATPAGAIARLLEMGIEPYQITSALHGVVAQRLARRRISDGEYRGRVPVAEFAGIDGPLRRAILARADASELAGIYGGQAGYRSMAQVAAEMARAGITDWPELERALGQSAPAAVQASPLANQAAPGENIAREL